jgi:hypothetical protein
LLTLGTEFNVRKAQLSTTEKLNWDMIVREKLAIQFRQLIAPRVR